MLSHEKKSAPPGEREETSSSPATGSQEGVPFDRDLLAAARKEIDTNVKIRQKIDLFRRASQSRIVTLDLDIKKQVHP